MVKRNIKDFNKYLHMNKRTKVFEYTMFLMIFVCFSCKQIPGTNGKYNYYYLENNSSSADRLNIIDIDSIIIDVDFEKVINL